MPLAAGLLTVKLPLTTLLFEYISIHLSYDGYSIISMPHIIYKPQLSTDYHL